MILVIYGQPGTGKTTLAKAYMERYYNTLPNYNRDFFHIDGDLLRTATRNESFRLIDREANCRLGNNIALYAYAMGLFPIVSMLHPFEDIRKELREKAPCRVCYVELTYSQDIANRGKEDRWVPYFGHAVDDPYTIHIDTGLVNVREAVHRIHMHVTVNKW